MKLIAVAILVLAVVIAVVGWRATSGHDDDSPPRGLFGS